MKKWELKMVLVWVLLVDLELQLVSILLVLVGEVDLVGEVVEMDTTTTTIEVISQVLV